MHNSEATNTPDTAMGFLGVNKSPVLFTMLFIGSIGESRRHKTGSCSSNGLFI
jgi:hypothetical protein